jgi:hypothetical protein
VNRFIKRLLLKSVDREDKVLQPQEERCSQKVFASQIKIY